MPNFIVCQDVNAQLELITNGHTKNHKCYFRAFDLVKFMKLVEKEEGEVVGLEFDGNNVNIIIKEHDKETV